MDHQQERFFLSRADRFERLDQLSGYFILGMLVFAPWAFGATQQWAIWILNIGAYVLGLIYFCKLWLLRKCNVQPHRWDDPDPELSPDTRKSGLLTRGLLVLTILSLVYHLISAINASQFVDQENAVYRSLPHVSWLPHSLSEKSTWDYFWRYLGLALFFWAARDWFLNKTERDAAPRPTKRLVLPEKLNLLVWVWTINGALLGIEGMIQRIEGSGHLLFLVKPLANQRAEDQFASYAYRSNAAQYFNLLWPVSLGWWQLLREKEARRERQNKGKLNLMLLCTIIMAICPVMAATRAGAALAVFNSFIAVCILLLGGNVVAGFRKKLGVFAVFLVVVALVVGASWTTWKKRVAEGAIDNVRMQIYRNTWKMFQDYPVFGTGPGSFADLYGLYKEKYHDFYPAEVHNDWLEILVTHGIAGAVLVYGCFILCLGHWFYRRGIRLPGKFVALMALSLFGCLLHAMVDFPLQVYSILLTFICICAVWSTMGRYRT
jgi:hypothetical protein